MQRHRKFLNFLLRYQGDCTINCQRQYKALCRFIAIFYKNVSNADNSNVDGLMFNVLLILCVTTYINMSYA